MIVRLRITFAGFGDLEAIRLATDDATPATIARALDGAVDGVRTIIPILLRAQEVHGVVDGSLDRGGRDPGDRGAADPDLTDAA